MYIHMYGCYGMYVRCCRARQNERSPIARQGLNGPQRPLKHSKHHLPRTRKAGSRERFSAAQEKANLR